MRVYLDLCAWKRPYDIAATERVTLEALSIAVILREAETGKVVLVSSEVLEGENSQNPNPLRRGEVGVLLARIHNCVPCSASIELRARELSGQGLLALDALHVASAEAGGCEFLVTTDDRMLKKLRIAKDLNLTPIDPLGLVRLIEGIDT